MNRAYWSRSLRRKLVAIVGLATVIGLLVCVTLLFTYDSISFRSELTHELQVEGATMGVNCSAPLSFGDKKNATEVLSSLSKNSRIEVAALYDRTGHLFASYRPPLKRGVIPASLPNVQAMASDNGFSVLSPIQDVDGAIGYIYLKAGNDEFIARTRVYFLADVFVVGLSLLISVLAASKLQSAITKPIESLVNGMELIGSKKDYSLRMKSDRTDEIGQLEQSFNFMLEEVELRDSTLERRVDERTQALKSEVAEREKAQQELSQALVKANAANLAKSHFVASMSHEIRTPMNGLIGMATYLLGSPLNPDTRDCIETIASSGRTLMSILNEILDFSKIEAGRMDVDRAQFHLDVVLSDAIAAFSFSAAQKNLSFKAEFDPSVKRQVIGDPVKLTRIFWNLIENAIKFTEAGEVVCTARVEDRDDGRFQFFGEVRDTGIGIPSSKLQTIFQPFTQAEAGAARRFGGTGLGLSICEQLAILMGGQLTVTSSVGQGSVFQFDVAMEPGLQLVGGGPVTVSDDKPAIEPRSRDHSVLLVEDNLINQKVAKRVLERLGCEVSIAADGLVAISKFGPGIDFVLMDCHMPGMDGFEATLKIRSMEAPGSRIPIIALTASALEEEHRRCMEVGMDDVFIKPINPNLIKQALDAIPTPKAA